MSEANPYTPAPPSGAASSAERGETSGRAADATRDSPPSAGSSRSAPVTAPNTPGTDSPRKKRAQQRRLATPPSQGKKPLPPLSPYGRPATAELEAYVRQGMPRSPRSPRSPGTPKSPFLRLHKQRQDAVSLMHHWPVSRPVLPNPTAGSYHVLNPRCFVQENEVQLMANRLNRLKKEEAKARRKVHTVLQKAEEIAEQKRAKLQKHQMKYMQVAAEYEMMQRQVAQAAYLREQHRENMTISREIVRREKLDNAAAIKQATKENEWLAAKFKLEEVARNRMSRDFIRSRQKCAPLSPPLQ